MDVRKRTSVAPANRENFNTLPGKGQETLKTTQSQQRRLVLGEIGNQVSARQNVNNSLPLQEVKKFTAKPSVTKVATKPTVAKVTTKPAVTKVATKPVVSKVTTKPAVTKVATKPVVSKAVTKPVVTKVSRTSAVSKVSTGGTVSKVSTGGTVSKVSTGGTVSRVANVTKEKEVKKDDKPITKVEKIPPPTAPKPVPLSFSSSLFNVLDVKNIDKDEANDPLLLGQYASDIHAYLRLMEAKYPIRQNHLEGQKLSGKMRAMLVDWIVDVHSQFQLLQETLYLTVANLDRFMQGVTDIHRSKFQLVGTTAMFIACKYEETYSPEVLDFVHVTDNSCSKRDILKMEERIVKSLDFCLGRPLAPHFLRRYTKAAQALPKNHLMARYFMELCLVDYEMCHIPPSQIAAAALYLSLRLCSDGKHKIWTDTLIHYSQYTFAEISPVVKKMAHLVLHAENNPFQAIRKKYASSQLMKISCAPELKCLPLQKLAQS